ncbi:ABC transporter ATP-binding protein [Zavarzinia aquatilis]|uniref:Spermidine/putrescine ABC transporter ATP-binding protein n=1 Tax=Zavarzinia aquatilis TaxID=2211142 RepID=A0A317EE16_9PROT|nr:ABC transporter ATP-binding protein [Zavarzinia aquatilis]PWR25159.1 spermidine/putrescine ABC transporter ATP-binding protein [Zavarzinia aquatilis]
MSDPLLRLRNISKNYRETQAVHPLDLDVERGDFVALLGPSGCGKTTLLRMIGGFLPPSTGTIEIGGQDVTALGPEKRNTNMVFQGYGLFPHMTVAQNIGYGPKIAGRDPEQIDLDVVRMLNLVHLGAVADRLPAALSGGQQQRVALARALVMRPSILLLDEPLAALDLKLRKAMQDELKSLHRAIGGTFIFVTHDQGEAIDLANRIVVMEAGRIVQQGTPEDVYRRPASRFVASFIGDANMLSAVRKGGEVEIGSGRLPSPGPDGPVLVVIRPDDIALAGDGPLTLAGTVTESRFMGPYLRLVVTLADGTAVTVHRPSGAEGAAPPPMGSTATLGLPAAACSVVAP